MQKLDRKSYYGTQKDINAYGFTKDKTFVTGIQYTLNLDSFLFMPSTLTAGSEYNDNRLEDEMLGYNRSIRQSVKMNSIYLQNEWKNEKISILLGSRFDKHNLINPGHSKPGYCIREIPFLSIKT